MFESCVMRRALLLLFARVRYMGVQRTRDMMRDVFVVCVAAGGGRSRGRRALSAAVCWCAYPSTMCVASKRANESVYIKRGEHVRVRVRVALRE